MYDVWLDCNWIQSQVRSSRCTVRKKKNTIIFPIPSCSSMTLRPGNFGDFVIVFGTDV